MSIPCSTSSLPLTPTSLGPIECRCHSSRQPRLLRKCIRTGMRHACLAFATNQPTTVDQLIIPASHSASRPTDGRTDGRTGRLANRPVVRSRALPRPAPNNQPIKDEPTNIKPSSQPKTKQETFSGVPPPPTHTHYGSLFI